MKWIEADEKDDVERTIHRVTCEELEKMAPLLWTCPRSLFTY